MKIRKPLRLWLRTDKMAFRNVSTYTATSKDEPARSAVLPVPSIINGPRLLICHEEIALCFRLCLFLTQFNIFPC